MRKREKLPLDELAPYLWEPEKPVAVPIDWAAVFGNANPVEIEVGCGKGLFLITAAQSRPGHHFFGVEVVRALQLYIATRAAKRSLANVRVAGTDARWLFRELVPTASVAAVHVYFPDPWWKARHKKRRVFTAEFAADCERVLRPGGELRIATDVEEYFAVMTELAGARPGLRPERSAVESGEIGDGEILTNFERKARQIGGSVWRAEYRKVGA